MKNPLTLLATTSTLALGACSSSISDALDGTTQARINTIEDCFPDVWEKVDAIFEIAKTWRLNTTTNPPDPAGLSWVEQGDGSVQVTLAVATCTIEMNIVF